MDNSELDPLTLTINQEITPQANLMGTYSQLKLYQGDRKLICGICASMYACMCDQVLSPMWKPEEDIKCLPLVCFI